MNLLHLAAAAPSHSKDATEAAGLSLELTIFLTIAALGGLAFISGRLGTHAKAPDWLRRLFATGYIFLGAGYLIGPEGLGIILPDIRDHLKPLAIFCMGWIGFLIGMQGEARLFHQLARRMAAFAFGQLIIVAVIIGIAFDLAASSADATILLAAQTSLLAAAVVGISAGVSSQGIPAIVRQRLGRPERNLLAVTTGLDDLFAMTIAIVFLTFTGLSGANNTLSVGLFWLSVLFLLGAILGWTFFFFLRSRVGPQESLTIGLGMLIFVAGAAFVLELPSPSLGFIAGIVLINARIPRKESFYKTLVRAERPIGFLMFLLAGTYLEVPRPFYLAILFPVGYCLIRAAVKVVATRALLPVVERPAIMGSLALGQDPSGRRLNPRLGWALLASGPLALVLAFDYFLLDGGPAARLAFWTVAMGALFNEAFAPITSRFFPETEKAKGVSAAIEKAKAAERSSSTDSGRAVSGGEPATA